MPNRSVRGVAAAGRSGSLRRREPGEPATEFEPVVIAPLRSSAGVGVFRVLPRTEFGWSTVSKGGSLMFQSPRYVDVESAEDALAVVRVHRAAGTGGGDVVFSLGEVAFSADDPEIVFAWPLAAATVRVTPGASGVCLTHRLRLDLGAHLRLMVTFYRGDVAAQSTGAYSLDLVTRSAGGMGGSMRDPDCHCAEGA